MKNKMFTIQLKKTPDQKMNILIANHKSDKVKKLKELLHQCRVDVNIVGSLESIEDTIAYYKKSWEHIDLAFFETQLSDGPSFEIFKQMSIKNPVVFTSATEQDAFNAIKANGLDYLLEPLNLIDINNALLKANLTLASDGQHENGNALKSPEFKKRFLVKYGYKMHFKTTEDTSYFYADGKMVYLVTRTGRSYIVEYTLDELEHKHLDPESFFRINRKYMIHIDAIDEVRSYANSRLKIMLNPLAEKDMIVSRDKVGKFKNWLNL